MWRDLPTKLDNRTNRASEWRLVRLFIGGTKALKAKSPRLQ
ncbi:hypothetical protein HMPREF0495_00892 [Levilactobacillus brevis ATCC 14869 = DSM 20054]|uniref:Uncharacterized protein n=1 Tax=Levilactobacillus brevis ATCC 14869 = DSM 20054 TaxID=649758 RepID=U2P239_LEVBR|nr:hypothetical protein HMPREF0495_00892 [Levilactobacillus brevis ATCC 14869 = DSM 20054]KIO98669.1 hypothetical protein QP38_1358 [Levilactobacillus brevis]